MLIQREKNRENWMASNFQRKKKTIKCLLFNENMIKADAFPL